MEKEKQAANTVPIQLATYYADDEWVQDYIAQFGEEPSFFLS